MYSNWIRIKIKLYRKTESVSFPLFITLSASFCPLPFESFSCGLLPCSATPCWSTIRDAHSIQEPCHHVRLREPRHLHRPRRPSGANTTLPPFSSRATRRAGGEGEEEEEKQPPSAASATKSKCSTLCSERAFFFPPARLLSGSGSGCSVFFSGFEGLGVGWSYAKNVRRGRRKSGRRGRSSRVMKVTASFSRAFIRHSRRLLAAIHPGDPAVAAASFSWPLCAVSRETRKKTWRHKYTIHSRIHTGRIRFRVARDVALRCRRLHHWCATYHIAPPSAHVLSLPVSFSVTPPARRSTKAVLPSSAALPASTSRPRRLPEDERRLDCGRPQPRQRR